MLLLIIAVAFLEAIAATSYLASYLGVASRARLHMQPHTR